MATKEDVMKELEGVMDPELGVSVVEMGFIEDVKVEGHMLWRKVNEKWQSNSTIAKNIRLTRYARPWEYRDRRFTTI